MNKAQLSAEGSTKGTTNQKDDLISRQYLIERLKIKEKCDECEWQDGIRCSKHNCFVDACEAIFEAPSVQPEPHWIPVSERLPEKYGQYLVTFIPSGGTLWTYVLIARYSDLMGIAKPSFHVGTVGKNDFLNITEQVTAWMPLPSPYQEEGGK